MSDTTATIPAEAGELLAAIESGAAEAQALSLWMGDHPELSLEERETSARYRSYLSSRGFEIVSPVADLETAFVARWGRSDAPVRIALLAEMDALPEIGHACGHNLSGPASLLAAHALRATLSPEAAEIVVVGCPAEETGVGKRQLVEHGVFADCDVAMMAHASDMRRAHRLFLGNKKFEYIFHGKAAHAAAYPEEGINALDGVIQLFVGIGALRQQLPRGVRVHGIVTDGGEAPNIIPERAAARFWIRSLSEAELTDASERVGACAEGAARATGTRLEIEAVGGTSPPMRANIALADAYRVQLDRMGLPETPHGPGEAIGSSDITHVSRVVPTIHPNFPIGESLKLHTRAFAEATVLAKGQAGLLEAARALALTGFDLTRDAELREAVRRNAISD